MKFVIKYAVGREEEVEADNINIAIMIANRNKRKEEVVMSIRSE